MAEADKDAEATVQEVLDTTARALLDGDFPRFAPFVSLPYATCTREGARLLRTQAEVRATFDKARAYYLSRGATRLARRVTAAHFDGPDRIRSASTAVALAGDRVLDDEHTVVSHLLCGADGRWRFTDARYDFGSATRLGDSFLASGLFDLDIPTNQRQALTIMQNVLDRIAHSYTVNNFAFLRDAVHLPLFKQGAQGAQVFDTVEALRGDFETYVLRLVTRNVTELVLYARTAQFLGEQRLHGVYRTHVLSGPQLLVPSYDSAVSLDTDGTGQWRLMAIMHPVDLPTLDRIVNTEVAV